MCDIIYIYPATSGLAGPRQLLVFLSSPRLLPCFLSPSCSPPPKRGAADMAGLPRVPVYLKKKKQSRTKPPLAPNPRPKIQTRLAPWRRPPPLALPFQQSHVGGPGPPSSPPISASALSSSSLHPPRGGMVIFCPTLVLRRRLMVGEGHILPLWNYPAHSIFATALTGE